MIKINLNSLINKTVNGGALYIAMMVGIIISLLLAMFMYLNRFNLRQVTYQIQNTQLQINLRSALELAKSPFFNTNYNCKWIKNQINDDSIRVKKCLWGAYTLLSIETKNRNNSLSQVGFYGTEMSSDTGLVVTENSRQVGMSGAISFKANCYLSSAGIKPAFIEGQSYIGISQNNSFLKPSPLQIPPINEDFVEDINRQQEILISSADTLMGSIPGSLLRSFNKSTVVLEPSSLISNVNFKNNIKIISQSELIVDSSCRFDNILIIAKKVRFKHGFKGAVHVIAEDSIITERNTVFLYPSSFVLNATEKSDKIIRSIVLNENTIFFGGIIAISDKKEGSSEVFIKLCSSSEVNGLIYSSGYMHIEGKLNANVYCDRLLLKTPSAVYENHLLSCEIDPSKYSNVLSVPFLFNKQGLFCLSKGLGG
jgi:hypothetical protein